MGASGQELAMMLLKIIRQLKLQVIRESKALCCLWGCTYYCCPWTQKSWVIISNNSTGCRGHSFWLLFSLVGRPGTPGQWWTLKQCFTTNIKTRPEMRRRNYVMPAEPASPVLTPKAAIARVMQRAPRTVPSHLQCRKKSQRYHPSLFLPRDQYFALRCRKMLWWGTSY